jgi:outer membrane protein assembly factor BamC
VPAFRSNRPLSRTQTLPHAGITCATAVVALLGGCSSVDSVLSGDKIDYRTSAAQTTKGLEVPPDLSQLSKDSRYQQQGAGGAVSAAAFQTNPMAAQPAPAVAPKGDPALRIERSGNERWLATSMPPEQLWPLLQSFWAERGFVLIVDQADVGVMETEWAENRAKLPQDLIRSTIGKVFDSVYSTGERDKFRTRVERGTAGSEVYISHRGMVEVSTGVQKDNIVWQPRPTDPNLEAELLQRLLLKLGAKEEQAQTLIATSTKPASRARVVQGQAAATIEMDDGFDRAWRRVGLALDRTGFTVEDRDRGQGLYYVRYVDPANASKEEPGFFSRMFGSSKKDGASLAKYRVQVKSEGERSVVSVLNAQGAAENGLAGTKIAALLVEELK